MDVKKMEIVRIGLTMEEADQLAKYFDHAADAVFIEAPETKQEMAEIADRLQAELIKILPQE